MHQPGANNIAEKRTTW